MFTVLVCDDDAAILESLRIYLSQDLQLLEVQPEGKKRMKAADFLRGKSIPYGTVLGKVSQK